MLHLGGVEVGAGGHAAVGGVTELVDVEPVVARLQTIDQGRILFPFSLRTLTW